MNVCSQQLSSLQSAAVNAPAASHDVFPDTMYPSSHVGWHVVSLNMYSTQSPTPPLAGGADALQYLTHTAGVRTPSSQTLGSGAKYPESHTGWHAVPLNSWSVQLPTAPLAGGDDASQNGMQIAGDRTLFSHTLGPDTAYPGSHTG